MSETSGNKVVRFIQRFNILNFYIGGFTINLSTYMCWLVLPLLMKERGDADPFMIGLADAVTFGITGLLSPIIGMVASRQYLCPDVICRIGFVLQATCAISIALFYITGTTLLPIFFLLIQESFALAFFWSICEYLLSNQIYKGETNEKMSWFCVSWSLGKAIGFVLGGPMRRAFGYSYSLYFSALIVLVAFVVFPRFPQNNSESVNEKRAKKREEKRKKKLEKKLEKLRMNGDVIEEKDVEIQDGNFLTRPRPIPHYFFMYYINELVVHFTVYGTIAVFGNQYIDFADENKIVLNGANDDPGTFCSCFLGIVYFSQSLCFFLLGQVSFWQYKQIFNVIVQVIIAAICVGLIYLRNGWILCVLAIPVGFISGFDLQSNVLYSINSGPKLKGLILGMSECVGELTCCLCPLFAGLIATKTNDRRWALWFGFVLQIVGIILCLITQGITFFLERRLALKEAKTGKEVELEQQNEDIEIDKNLVSQIQQEGTDESTDDEEKSAGASARPSDIGSDIEVPEKVFEQIQQETTLEEK
ncbi:hypothetical protein EIN_056470 [Entamoeba invadens IP1]|uniref:hypothetical protein n=1 Tax=Entamoeba invadens IP1 TaxID=370355 RepID=UPI0002C3EA17|nr:hypothetical protein EIN_056470 [Entamoeba invadens IP1]ELP93272.1 hypothetical protein EIN_056470 [Entamoeba invadens IP1]|eukprot:XP_004260043.1 hypothetical protein EIN_056470 [Entamoeba invadens IP1]